MSSQILMNIAVYWKTAVPLIDNQTIPRIKIETISATDKIWNTELGDQLGDRFGDHFGGFHVLQVDS